MAKRVAELEVLVTANTGQAKRELDSVSRSFHNIIAGGALLGAGGGILGWFKDAITSGAAFEQTMIRVQQLATGTEVSVDALTKKAFAVDQATIYSAQQIAEAMEQLGREGFTGEQILGSWTDAAVNFAAVINEDLVSATNIFGQVARVFKDENLSAAETANILSQAILRSGRPAAEFATGMQYIGSIAAQFGASLDETATSLSYLQSLGIKGRSAGTGIRSMFIELAAGADEFGMSHGVQAFDPVTGAFVGIPSIIDQFGELIATMSKADALSFLSDIFGKPASSPLFALFSGGTEAYEEHRQKMEDLGSAATFMRTLMDTIAGSLDRFEAAASNAMRKLGVIAGTMIKPFLDMFTAALGAFTDAPRIVHIATVAIIAFAAAMATLTGAMMVFRGLGGFGLLLSGLKLFSFMSFGAFGALGLLVGGLLLFGDKLGAWKDALGEALEPFGLLLDYLSQINQGNMNSAAFLMQFAPGPMRELARGLGWVVEAFADLWYFASRGDWDRLLTRLPGELAQMWKGVQIILDGTVSEIDWVDWISRAVGWTGENIVWPAITALVQVGFDLVVTAIGWAGDLWAWIKGKLFPGTSGPTAPDGTGGPEQFGGEAYRTITVGDVIVEAGVQLVGAVLNAAGRLEAWLKEQVLGVGSGDPNSGSPGQVRAGGAGPSSVEIEIAQILIKVLDATTDLNTQDVEDWLQEQVDTFTTIETELSAWAILIQSVPTILFGESEGGPGSQQNIIETINNELEGLADHANGEHGLLIDLFNFTARLFGVPDMQASSPSELSRGVRTAIEAALKYGSLRVTMAGVAAILTDWDKMVVTGLNVLGAVLAEKATEAITDAGMRFIQIGVQIVQFIMDGVKLTLSTIAVQIAQTFVELYNDIASLLNNLPGISLPEFEVYVTESGGVDIREKGKEEGDKIVSDYQSGVDDAMSGAIVTAVLPEIRTEQQNAFFTPYMTDPQGNQYVQHSPGEGYALDQGPPTVYEPSRFGVPKMVEVDVVPRFRESDAGTLKTDIESSLSDIKASIKLDGIDSVMTDFAAAFDMGRAWASTEHKSTAKLDILDVINNHIKAAQLATAWANSGPHTAYAHLNIEDVKTQANFAWSIGNQWDGTTFTASFSVDVSGLYAARDTAALVAQEIADMMPHSPAKEGPLKEPISFAYIADEFDLAADAIRTTSAALAGDVAAAVDMPYATGGRLDVQAPQVRNVTINNFALTANDLAKLQQDAENGKLIVSGAAYELDMTLGV